IYKWMLKMKLIIYKITNILNNKMYIGQSQTSLERRWTLHKSDAKTNRDNYHFHNAIRKYGTECWKQEVLEEVEDISNLNEAEMKWIEYYDTFNNGYNCTNGGENGKIISEETKEKMRQSKLGKKMTDEAKLNMSLSMKKRYEDGWVHPMLNNKHSEETKKHWAKIRKGVKKSEKTKEKISKATKGKLISEETKEKIRQAQLGKITAKDKDNNIFIITKNDPRWISG